MSSRLSHISNVALRRIRVLCVSIEASGDRLLALVIQALKKAHQGEIELMGVGGPLSQAEGLDSLIDPKKLAAHGLIEALHVLPQTIRAYMSLRQMARNIDLCLFVDAPEINMRLLAYIKTHKSIDIRQTKVLYIAPPQVWAWRSYRAKKLALADQLFCLFNFEAKWFQQHHINAHLIGHPLALTQVSVSSLDHNKSLESEEDQKRKQKPLVIALFPGSRQSSVKLCLELAILSLAKFALALKQALIIQVAVTPWVKERLYSKLIAKAQRRLIKEGWVRSTQQVVTLEQTLETEVLEHRSNPESCITLKPIKQSVYHSQLSSFQAHPALNNAIFSVCYAGTATLESALSGVIPLSLAPLSKVSAWLAKRLIRVEHCTLPNLCLNERAFPELHLEQCTPESILITLVQMYENLDTYQAQFERLRIVLKPWAEKELMNSLKYHLNSTTNLTIT